MIKADQTGTEPTRTNRLRPAIALGVLLTVMACLGIVSYLATHAEPLLKRRVISNLEQRFHSPVELDALHISVLHGIQVTGSGLRILYLAGPDRPSIHQASQPMVSVKTFEFHSSLRQLFQPTMRVVTVYVQGMQIDIPPRARTGSPDDPKRVGQPKVSLIVDKIVCDNLTLSVETSNPDKPPLVFPIHQLTLKNVGAKQPMDYEAVLVNPKPVGDVHSTGTFGPWQDDNPRDTPITGRYEFTHADLATIKGIGGTLSSTGTFSGQLSNIEVSGSTDTPDFIVSSSDHPVALHTDFQAIVDGTSGDTTLQQVRAEFLKSVLWATGSIYRSNATPTSDPPGFPGHDIELAVHTERARVEDFLTLAVKTSPPLVRGPFDLKATLSIKPGPVPVPKKMHLAGTFAIHQATFSNTNFQDTVDRLSKRAQGRPDEARKEVQAPVVASQLGGAFDLANAVLHLPGLNYAMPGAQVHLAGDYSLDGQRFEFAGTVRTQVTASEMLTGWKSLLAMPFDPLLKKNGAGVELPITISGTRSEPKFGVDLDKMHLGFLKMRK